MVRQPCSWPLYYYRSDFPPQRNVPENAPANHVQLCQPQRVNRDLIKKDPVRPTRVQPAALENGISDHVLELQVITLHKHAELQGHVGHVNVAVLPWGTEK